MDKRIALNGLALLGLIVSSTALAETTPGFYIGAGIGEASFGNDATVGSDFSGNDTAFKGLVGYNISKYLAVEAAYFDGGEVGQEFAGMSFVGSVEASASGLNFSVLGRAPLTDEFSVFAKLGVASYDFDVTTSIRSRFGQSVTKESHGDEDLSYGVGAAFSFGNSFELRGEFEAVDVSSADFTLLSISALYKF